MVSVAELPCWVEVPRTVSPVELLVGPYREGQVLVWIPESSRAEGAVAPSLIGKSWLQRSDQRVVAPAESLSHPHRRNSKVAEEADILDWAPSARERVLDRIRLQGEADAIVHEKTLEERDKGWAKGPISRDSLQGSSLVGRKFGLRQGEKTRLIDDLSFSGVNELVTVQESPKPHGPDMVAASMFAFMKAAPGVPLEGRPYDLRSAYRQLPIHPESLQHAFVTHWNPGPASVEIDQLLALPFGASRSVFGFIRAATSIWRLGCASLGFCWSIFFDDFITLSKAADVRHTQAAAATFFRMLGWLFDECGSKAVDLSICFKALGVIFDLSQARQGFVTLSNTPARIAELSELIPDLLATKRLTRAEAQRLRGRMQFCDGFLVEHLA
eukprot:s651_g3.t3